MDTAGLRLLKKCHLVLILNAGSMSLNLTSLIKNLKIFNFYDLICILFIEQEMEGVMS